MKHSLLFLVFGTLALSSWAASAAEVKEGKLNFKYVGSFSLTGSNAGADGGTKEYTDLKSCVTEAKAMMFSGITGSTSCGLTVKVGTVDRFLSPGKHPWSAKGIVPNTLSVELISGGGGGYSRSRKSALGIVWYDGGEGGSAGQYAKDAIPGYGFDCELVVGAAGAGGKYQSRGSDGGNTSMRCTLDGSVIYNKALEGGKGGQNPTSNNCGTNGQNLTVSTSTGPVVIGKGGDRACKDGWPRAGVLGGGGGGAGDNSNTHGSSGAAGGPGRIHLSYRAARIEDPNKVLAKLNTCPEMLMGASSCPPPVTCIALDGGWSDYGEWDEAECAYGPGSKYRYRTCSSPFPSCGGLECSGPSEEQVACGSDKFPSGIEAAQI
jgi:hypothetical protein